MQGWHLVDTLYPRGVSRGRYHCNLLGMPLLSMQRPNGRWVSMADADALRILKGYVTEGTALAPALMAEGRRLWPKYSDDDLSALCREVEAFYELHGNAVQVAVREQFLLLDFARYPLEYGLTVRSFIYYPYSGWLSCPSVGLPQAFLNLLGELRFIAELSGFAG